MIEISNNCLNIVYSGDYVDKVAFHYLNPEKEIFYFINGGPCMTFRNAIELIKNKRIIEINELDQVNASAIWGSNYGKNGALIINTEKNQDNSNVFTQINNISNPSFFLAFDSKEIKIKNDVLEKINPKWIKKLEVRKTEEEKYMFGNKTPNIFIYPKKRHLKKILKLLQNQNKDSFY